MYLRRLIIAGLIVGFYCGGGWGYVLFKAHHQVIGVRESEAGFMFLVLFIMGFMSVFAGVAAWAYRALADKDEDDN